MTLPVQTYAQIVNQQQNAMQAQASVPLDFSNGSVLGALVNANAGNFMWLQAIATSLLAITRLSTCSGNDCDTFCADFGFYRYGGNVSTGTVTFSRAITTDVAIIYIGSIVSVSTVSNLNFQVVANTASPYYDDPLNAYVIPIGTTQIDVNVICQQAGTIGNVAIGAIDTINSIIPNADFVTNKLAFTNGTNTWSDNVFKQEFALYIQSLTRATGSSINYIVSVTNASLSNAPKVVRYIVIENYRPDGVTPSVGFFYVVVDDGTGSPNQSLITAVQENVEQYRGLTISYNVIGPTPVSTSIAVRVKLIAQPTESQQQISANIVGALTNFVNSLGFNQTLYYTRVAQIVYDADANVLDVDQITINNKGDPLPFINTQLPVIPVNGITVTFV